MEQESIPKPTKNHQTLPSINQHYNTQRHSVYRNIILVVVYCLSIWKDPSLSLKINFGRHVAIDFIHPWILLLGDLSTFQFILLQFLIVLFSLNFKARFSFISFWYFLLEQDMEWNNFYLIHRGKKTFAFRKANNMMISAMMLIIMALWLFKQDGPYH